MSTNSAALTCSASQRIGPSFAIMPCCHMSTAILQPPCHCRNSASATTPCWKTGFSAGYTMRTGMGMMGDIYDGLKPKDLERFSLKILSGDRERGVGGNNKSSTSGFSIKQCFVSHLIFFYFAFASRIIFTFYS